MQSACGRLKNKTRKRNFNHSKNLNSLSVYYDDEEEVITKAIKDIKKGEEITDDYSSFDKDFSENW